MDLLLLVLIGIIVFIILIFVTQLLWNYIMPELFEVKKITFLQTLGLMILISLLFGGHCNHISTICVKK